MQNVVSQRFLQCLTHLLDQKIVRSCRQFALQLGYVPQSLNEIKKGNRDVTIELCRKAIETFNINPSYLFTGEGDLFTYMNGDADSDTSCNDIPLLKEEIVYVPVAAQAGYGDNIQDPVMLGNFETFTLPNFRYQHNSHRCFDVAGDSMEPTLYSGDKIVCSHLEQENWIHGLKDNLVYVVITNCDVVVKRVLNRIKEAGRVELYSDNSYYEAYRLPVEEVKEVWVVKTKISPFMPSPKNIRNALHEEVGDLKRIIRQQSDSLQGLNNTIEMMLKQNRSRI